MRLHHTKSFRILQHKRRHRFRIDLLQNPYCYTYLSKFCCCFTLVVLRTEWKCDLRSWSGSSTFQDFLWDTLAQRRPKFPQQRAAPERYLTTTQTSVGHASPEATQIRSTGATESHDYSNVNTQRKKRVRSRPEISSGLPWRFICSRVGPTTGARPRACPRCKSCGALRYIHSRGSVEWPVH